MQCRDATICVALVVVSGLAAEARVLRVLREAREAKGTYTANPSLELFARGVQAGLRPDMHPFGAMRSGGLAAVAPGAHDRYSLVHHTPTTGVMEQLARPGHEVVPFPEDTLLGAETARCLVSMLPKAGLHCLFLLTLCASREHIDVYQLYKHLIPGLGIGWGVGRRFG